MITIHDCKRRLNFIQLMSINTNMPILFFAETLRLLAPATRTERMCTKDYRIPGTDVIIEKGKTVVMPVFSMQRDPRYYENPLKFDPERFLPENKSKRHPYSFAPFGHGKLFHGLNDSIIILLVVYLSFGLFVGPRNCIGMRFALTEVKAVILALVQKFKLEPCGKTDIPPKFGNNSTLKPANGMWFNIQPRSED